MRHILLIMMLSGFATMASAQETRHEFPSADTCQSCHEENIFPDKQSPICHFYCQSCHKDMSGHHKVGAQLEETINTDLRFYRNREVSCWTCHNVFNEPFSDVPMKAQSLFGSVFKKKKKYKSYYLVCRNNKGQLCLNCH